MFNKIKALTMHENEISEKVIGCAIEVHKILGPGLLESVYEECLAAEFDVCGIRYERQKSVPVVYRNIKLESGYRLDFLIENKVILELKAIEVVPPVAYAQLLTYLRLMNKKLGLLINFNVPYLKDGIKRVVNNL
jgi:GxxExxY protein